MNHAQKIAASLQVRPEQVAATIALLPFAASGWLRRSEWLGRFGQISA